MGRRAKKKEQIAGEEQREIFNSVRDKVLQAFQTIGPQKRGDPPCAVSVRSDGLPANTKLIASALAAAVAVWPDHPLFLLFAPPEIAYFAFMGRVVHRKIPTKRMKMIAGLRHLSIANTIAAGGLLCFRDAVLQVWDSPAEREKLVVGASNTAIVCGRQTAAEILAEDFEMSLLNKIRDNGTNVEQDCIAKVLAVLDGSPQENFELREAECPHLARSGN